ncbi:type VII secretion-associated serine protease mycosin [Polymorphospora rubra]|uniref:type VII secretion-associated serine protease mycosin n=1 Tax=Polymorphospora rubra TaxID=338584 RepID=UPI0034044120
MRLSLSRSITASLCSAILVFASASNATADEIRNSQWHLKFLNVAQAHRISEGQGTTVAVIDTGTVPHPDLRNNLLPGIDLTSANSNAQQDDSGHGTAMAGIIAAHGDSNTGALGIAPRAKILPIRDRSAELSGDSDRLADAVTKAVEQNVQIINISSAGGPSARLRMAIQSAAAADIVVVAGVGNHPGLSTTGFPAMYEGTLAVGATDRQGNHSPISVTGERIQLTAPGVDIFTTRPNDSYRSGTGTSGAAAIVSGAAALVRSKFPELSAKEVVHRLTATAVDKGPPGRDEQYGYGVLDLVAALTADVPPLGASADPSVGPSPGPSGSSAAGQPPGNGSSGGWRPGVFVLGAVAAVGLVGAALFVNRRRRRGFD